MIAVESGVHQLYVVLQVFDILNLNSLSKYWHLIMYEEGVRIIIYF